jgi:hypothetical protein
MCAKQSKVTQRDKGKEEKEQLPAVLLGGVTVPQEHTHMDSGEWKFLLMTMTR